ncbi:MAG: hypothetical protein CBC42_01470 [Betaproteobacteria bacterium TMED82]|nr:MAG: hypothetical protein CBC42_01470 [Betaproteobacteria bacterium TMED82]|tara:strand:+ start:28232 stop:29686 length:1455 start_codon:yes stop_codon:yes gene_type:complete
MKDSGFSFRTTYTALPKQFFTKLSMHPVASPKLVIVNDTLADSMGLNFSNLTEEEKAILFSGNQLPEGSTPFAQAYAGHQFGYYTMLGDGRAHIWGEHLTPEGVRLDIQFKGSGRTPYSRGGDGKAALGPMLREYLISEGIHYLGIPTTRSLAVVKTGEQVMREVLLPGAILTRVASSHIRIGTFEFAFNHLGKEAVKTLMNYTIQRHYPKLMKSKDKAIDLIYSVMERQVDLIVHWMRVGFIHGVMNTDNMTLSGETIDYGPCAFMNAYDPSTVFSSIDHLGRYAFANQSKIAQWNLVRFAETLLQVIDDDVNRAVDKAKEVINLFPEIFQNKWLTMMRSKLGLFNSHTDDDKLIGDFLNWMHRKNADYTNTFLDISGSSKPVGKLYNDKTFNEWYLRWQSRLELSDKPLKSSSSLMRRVNPSVIPRNHKVEEALEAANGNDFKACEDLLSALEAPYTNRRSLRPYQTLPKSGTGVYKTFCGT